MRLSGCSGVRSSKKTLSREQVRILVVDRFDAQQGEVALVFLRRADLAGDRGAGPQAEAADLARRDVDVVGAGQVVVVGAAEEAEAVGQDFQRALAEHQAVELHPLFEDLKIRSCFLMPAISARFSLRACSISSGIVIRCSSAMWTLRSCASSLRDRGADAADAFGRFVELFGEREWFFAIELGEELAIDFYIAVAIGWPHATVHGWTRAIRPRVAVRLISHELFAPGEESGGARMAPVGWDLKKMDLGGLARTACHEVPLRPYYVMPKGNVEKAKVWRLGKLRET